MRQCQHVTDVSLSARVKQMFQHLPIRSIGSGNAAISNLLLSPATRLNVTVIGRTSFSLTPPPPLRTAPTVKPRQVDRRARGERVMFHLLLLWKPLVHTYIHVCVCVCIESFNTLRPPPRLSALVSIALHSCCNDFYTELSGCCLNRGSQSAMPLRPTAVLGN